MDRHGVGSVDSYAKSERGLSFVIVLATVMVVMRGIIGKIQKPNIQASSKYG